MKVELEESEKKLSEDALRTMLLKGTLEHIVSQLTPERLEVFLQGTLGKMFEGLLHGYSSPLQKAAEEHATKIVRELIAQPSVQARIKEACVKALNKYIDEVPEKLANNLALAAKNGIVSTFELPDEHRRR